MNIKKNKINPLKLTHYQQKEKVKTTNNAEVMMKKEIEMKDLIEEIKTK